jgi:uncharacterized protein (DUF885 family)
MKRWIVLASMAVVSASCTRSGGDRAAGGSDSGDTAFTQTLQGYVVEFLRRNPTTNTYLGGAGLDSSLREVDGMLRDHSAAALQNEDRWLTDTQKGIEAINPSTLSTAARIDRDVALAQIRFLLHQHQVRRYQERALDTYVSEPFRALDWQMQGMTQTGENTYGTEDEWALVIKRVEAIPRFLATAQEQLLIGVKMNNAPDRRMIQRDGINTSQANAQYFAATLPKLAADRIAGSARDRLVTELGAAAKQASGAYLKFRDFINATYFDGSTPPKLKPEFAADRYQMGAEEYDWAVRNNFRIEKTAAQLFDEAWPIVEDTQQQMMKLARDIGAAHKWNLPAEGATAVRAVFDQLSKDYPKSDAEMVSWYRDAAQRLVEFGRKTGMFDVPADYKLEVVETPPPLQASIDGAAYYPAPPFKNSGVGRFYVTPTHNDPAALQSNNRASLADLAAHEGFPGHDWYYKVLTQIRDQVSPVRWLTPGAVEDSSSMWEDSMSAEGWGLYAEALMAEPQPGAPNGFYTSEERLYQLQGKLYRDLRVRIDTGIHTGRMTYDEATTMFSEVVDFLPGSCTGGAKPTGAKRASCESAERAIFRYSKWPTQAITYRLGKDQIYALREEAARRLGDRFSLKTFHLRFIRQGTIPPGYFRDVLLNELRQSQSQ